MHAVFLFLKFVKSYSIQKAMGQWWEMGNIHKGDGEQNIGFPMF